MSDLDTFQQRVGDWADATFTHATLESISDHFFDEVCELGVAMHAAAGYPKDQPIDDQDEAADVLLLLLHWAHRRGFSLFEAAKQKHTVNQQRQWGEPDARGVVRHVEAATAEGEG